MNFSCWTQLLKPSPEETKQQQRRALTGCGGDDIRTQMIHNGRDGLEVDLLLRLSA